MSEVVAATIPVNIQSITAGAAYTDLEVKILDPSAGGYAPAVGTPTLKVTVPNASATGLVTGAASLVLQQP
jgi:hypothetical protein